MNYLYPTGKARPPVALPTSVWQTSPGGAKQGGGLELVAPGLWERIGCESSQLRMFGDGSLAWREYSYQSNWQILQWGKHLPLHASGTGTGPSYFPDLSGRAQPDPTARVRDRRNAGGRVGNSPFCTCGWAGFGGTGHHPSDLEAPWHPVVTLPFAWKPVSSITVGPPRSSWTSAHSGGGGSWLPLQVVGMGSGARGEPQLYPSLAA